MTSHPLKVAREERGWSQSRVAEQVGTTTRTVSRWETGQAIPYPYYRERLSILFGKSIAELGFAEKTEEELVPASAPLDDFSLLPDEEKKGHNPAPPVFENDTSIAGYIRSAPFWTLFTTKKREKVMIMTFFICSIILFAIISIITFPILFPVSRTMPRPQSRTIIYYAVSPTTMLSGKASIDDCAPCTGGKKVYRVGYNQAGPKGSVQNGTVRFTAISKRVPGSYKLTLQYINADASRTLCIQVNDGQHTCFQATRTGNTWYSPGSLSITVTLKAGSNTITFDNPSAPAPDIVMITV